MIAVPSVLVKGGCAQVFISKTESADKKVRRSMLKENRVVHTDGGKELYVIALMELALFDFDSEFASHYQRLFSLSKEHQADVIEAVLAVLREKAKKGDKDSLAQVKALELYAEHLWLRLCHDKGKSLNASSDHICAEAKRQTRLEEVTAFLAKQAGALREQRRLKELRSNQEA